MPHIRKFELYYGSYFGPNEELVWQNGQLLYRWGCSIPDKERLIYTDEVIWKAFLSAVEGVVADWKRYYDRDVCDGLTWGVDIETDVLKISSGGNHHFPEHYDSFLQHVRTILRCSKFARGHSQRDYLVTGTEPDFINRKIRYLLRRKHLTLQKLADCLGYSKEWVRLQLNATTTFETTDLAKIARFLDCPLMDLLYEGDLWLPSRSKKETIVLPRIRRNGIENPVTDFRKDLPDLLKIDPTRMS